MFFITDDMNAEQIVREMYNYMIERGIGFRRFNVNNTPRAILKGKTSIGYRKHSKHGQSGIVFYCYKDEVDKNALINAFDLTVYDNSETCRPYALYISATQFEEAVEVLRRNDFNLA